MNLHAKNKPKMTNNLKQMIAVRVTILSSSLLLILITATSVLTSCTTDVPRTSHEQTPELIGTWDVKSISWINSNTSYVFENAQPGMFMVDATRNSTMWIPTRRPRVPFDKLSTPSDEETIAGFRSVVVNAGTYAYTDSTLTTTAMIAKVPGFEVGTQYYPYSIVQDQMELTMFDETYPDGSKPDWAGTFVTQFTMSRAQ